MCAHLLKISSFRSDGQQHLAAVYPLKTYRNSERGTWYCPHDFVFLHGLIFGEKLHSLKKFSVLVHLWLYFPHTETLHHHQLPTLTADHRVIDKHLSPQRPLSDVSITMATRRRAELIIDLVSLPSETSLLPLSPCTPPCCHVAPKHPLSRVAVAQLVERVVPLTVRSRLQHVKGSLGNLPPVCLAAPCMADQLTSSLVL